MISDPAPDGPIFGRAQEIDDFARLLRDRTKSSITLLGGDAGMGKTRLVREVTAHCRRAGGVALVGRCLDLGDDAAPYLPITDIVRTLRDLPTIDGIVSIDRLAPAASPRPIEFFEAIATMLDELAGRAPALVVFEDVHWADRSTRELLTYLFTHGVPAGVHLVATYRTDDLHRRHPLRPSLAEWSRLPQVRRVLLEPLEIEPARDLVRHLQPELADDAARQIIRRAGGNPFFTEELVATSMCCDPDEPFLPADLADLLLVRTDALSDDARLTLRAASVAGSDASEDTLQGLTELPTDRLHTALRAAVDAHLLVTSRTGLFDFRHALLAEAMYDDLLPGERVRLHDRLTDLLLAQPGPGTAAAVALHAERAGRFADALQARVLAGQEALDKAAPANAARHFESAIELATGHPELTEVPGDLSERAAEALLAAGDPHRAAGLIRHVLSDFTGTSLERARLLRLYLSAVLLTDMPTMEVKLRVPDLPGEADKLLDIAIGWARDADDNVLLGQLLALKAHYLLVFERHEESAVAANDALTVGRIVDEPSIISDATTTQAKLDGLAGDMTSALATLRQVRERAAAEDDIRAELRALHQIAGLQTRTDQIAEAADTYAEAIRRATEAHAGTEIYAIDSIIFAATLASKTGDWASVDRLLARTEDLPPLARASAGAVRLTVDVARGRFDQALSAHEKLHEHWPREMFILVSDAAGTIDLLGLTGDLDGAFALFDEAVAIVHKVWRLSVFDAQIRMAALLLTHLADSIDERPRSASEWATRIAQLDQMLEAVLSVRGWRESLGVESRAWFARARAELARLDGDHELAVTEYQESIRQFDDAGFVYERAVVEFLLSRELQAHGERSEARSLSERALATARQLGAAHLVRQLRGRSRAENPRDSALTPREQDVLHLVAEGMTNGQVAARLFISTKTASVHVSNILAKLGAATRTEAVDLARQRALLD
ncbi:MAG TPA: AAA family ATPase [Flexivirga sp.]|uniref:helix-turn-helix transcriptional regulator n=1 Tax=Flexivirga sp. TaxID=1962927 RepID=UPI002C7203C7|nr:AAA family ATPase [Flexivirga sp.]HWC23669.1 AAA family ATPase [Flexivirga sp.]